MYAQPLIRSSRYRSTPRIWSVSRDSQVSDSRMSSATALHGRAIFEDGRMSTVVLCCHALTMDVVRTALSGPGNHAGYFERRRPVCRAWYQRQLREKTYIPTRPRIRSITAHFKTACTIKLKATPSMFRHATVISVGVESDIKYVLVTTMDHPFEGMLKKQHIQILVTRCSCRF
jgi:hypothetical protein